jgi:uncharacterized protein YjeT (DUF2065 family)
MTDLIAALGLVLIIEGIFYAGFPEAAKAFMRQALAQPESTFRIAGLAAVAVGLLLVWLVRG